MTIMWRVGTRSFLWPNGPLRSGDMSAVQPDAAVVGLRARLVLGLTGDRLAIPFGVAACWSVRSSRPCWTCRSDFSIAVPTTSTVGAGVGWFVGASIGYWVRRESPPTSEVQVWALRIVAVIVVLTGLWMADGLPARLRSDDRRHRA